MVVSRTFNFLSGAFRTKIQIQKRGKVFVFTHRVQYFSLHDSFDAIEWERGFDKKNLVIMKHPKSSLHY